MSSWLFIFRHMWRRFLGVSVFQVNTLQQPESFVAPPIYLYMSGESPDVRYVVGVIIVGQLIDMITSSCMYAPYNNNYDCCCLLDTDCRCKCTRPIAARRLFCHLCKLFRRICVISRRLAAIACRSNKSACLVIPRISGRSSASSEAGSGTW